VPAVSRYHRVNAPVEKVYATWRDFTNFPRFLPHVAEVTAVGDDPTLTHWKVSGPLGKPVEWDARITEDVPNEKIAWASLDGSDVRNAGVVRFDARGEATDIEVAVDYDPPAGVAGAVAARLFDDPEEQVAEALRRFQEVVEQA
jgi:uncharacterized membrane protein